MFFLADVLHGAVICSRVMDSCRVSYRVCQAGGGCGLWLWSYAGVPRMGSVVGIDQLCLHGRGSRQTWRQRPFLMKC